MIVFKASISIDQQKKQYGTRLVGRSSEAIGKDSG